ncbi:hypothetical protein BC629DRAFT_804150 [Irpex lacteus]|nr:hypothetical protein BC629DRAFT_804150 [Irpex lacteus]
MSPVYYAYAKHATNEVTYRYLIVFATRSVADEWWRVVSTTTSTPVAGTIKRITPQLYTHDPGKFNIIQTIAQNNVAAQLSTQIVFVLQSNRDAAVPFEIIPPVPRDFADHLSGNWFYIRTPGPNPAYWYYTTADKSGVVVASHRQSTRFRITAVGSDVKRGTVLINSDLVDISFWGGKLNTAGNGALRAAERADQFKFGDFFGTSSGYRINAYGENIVGGLWHNTIIKTDKDDAQEWELSLEGAVGQDQ